LKRLHILFISSWYPVPGKPTHGIFNRYFAEAVSQLCDVSVLHVASSDDPVPTMDVKEEPGLRTTTVFYRKVRSSIPIWSAWMKYRRAIRAAMIGYNSIKTKYGRPDLMQLNVIMPAGPIALKIATLDRLPLVISENWSGYTREDNNYRGFMTRYFTKKLVSRASRIMPTSEYLAEAMRYRGLRGRYTVVPNVVNTEVFRIQPLDPKKGIHFIHVSSLNDREKNVSGLLRAFLEARNSHPDLSLVIVGEGIDEPKYRRFVNENKLSDSVTFRGTLNRASLSSEISSCDALVMFSNYETFCLVIPEAWACGKPVITSAAGAIPTYFKPNLGMMVPVGDTKRLKEAMLSFARGNFDADAIRSYAVDQFSYQNVAHRLLAIYTDTLGGAA
jgi:glycosyltransferase involved in cell wall biosynthesis